MGSLINLLAGIKVLEEVESKYNGKIVVQTDLVWGPHILVDGLSQSGGVVKQIWRKLFNRIKSSNPKNILILGLGGGTIAKLSRKHWPDSKITGVEIDPEMVRLGEKHLDLKNISVEVHIQDASRFLFKNKIHFDLILVDIYTGRGVPEQFTTSDFVEVIKKTLTTDGIAVFNRLYGPDNRKAAYKFLAILKKVFPEVDAFYPEANVMYICKKY